MPTSLKNRKILVTYGPTWVALDDVRVISNRSSGKLGQMICLALKKAGAKVTALEGPVENGLKTSGIRIEKFQYFDELSALLKRELNKSFDAVIHLAAVADYRPAAKSRTKIPSSLKHFTIRMEPTPKLIQTIKKIRPDIFLVGFKLETFTSKQDLVQKSRGLFVKALCDLVVANSGFEPGRYRSLILQSTGNILAEASSRQTMAEQLVKSLERLL